MTGGYALGQGYRTYLPGLMRFASPDDWSPFGRGGIHGYAYVRGDPVNRSDPSGHILEEDFLRVVWENKPDRLGRQRPETPPAVYAPQPGFNEIEDDHFSPGAHVSDDAPIGTARARHDTNSASPAAGHVAQAGSVKAQLAAAFALVPEHPSTPLAPDIFDVPSAEATPYHPVLRTPIGEATMTVATGGAFSIGMDDGTGDLAVTPLTNPHSTPGAGLDRPRRAPLWDLRQWLTDFWSNDTDVYQVLFSPVEPRDPPPSRWPALQGKRE
ncbi:RHS repeat-associated core domain-containing protein [Bordetella bronchialis]|uniref:RHS repeat-associated core domain-containing protein n=1 Tax=Bordetella bronchialis TaxID=463025 RepID=UPI001E552140|nr:RHS repeat-associated core domain-containing protein [Bordetella bronchialis]